MIATTLQTDAIAASRDGFATDISSLPANSLEFFERGIKKRARKFYEMLNFPADGGEAGAQFLRGFIKSAR